MHAAFINTGSSVFCGSTGHRKRTLAARQRGAGYCVCCSSQVKHGCGWFVLDNVLELVKGQVDSRIGTVIR